MLKWKEDYIVGIESIDEQHKMLFQIANKAYELLENDMYVDKYDRIILVLGELRDYAAYHFKCEEDYMQSIGYKRFFSQKVEHDQFIKKVKDIDFSKIDHNQDAYLISLLEFVVNWISEHIFEKDMLIAEKK